mmetsp:Transcript_30377/g.65297  ORF Transcript_30377/g.65297 Transcript_30377/m.65297 type:complete len:1165 (-) Transcript_30377:261-3755(-)
MVGWGVVMNEERSRPAAISFAGSFLDYDMLKTEIYRQGDEHDILDGGGGKARAERFKRCMQREINELNEHVEKTSASLVRTLADLLRKAANVPPPPSPVLEELQKACVDAGETLSELFRFVDVNKTATRKIVKKCDKVHAVAVHFWLDAQLREAPFCNTPLEPLMLLLSDCHAELRNRENASPDGSTPGEAWVPPTDFERKTTKYWVLKEDVPKLTTEVLRHLSVLIMGRTPPAGGGSSQELLLEPSDHDADRSANPNPNPDADRSAKAFYKQHYEGTSVCNWISSLYLDTDEFIFYRKRLARDDFAMLFRLRWYGLESHAAGKVYVERKTHRSRESGIKSSKERFAIEPDTVGTLLSPEHTLGIDSELGAQVAAGTISEKQRMKCLGLCEEIDAAIKEEGMLPAVRTVYQRTAFQATHCNAVRLTLDSNLRFVKEAMQLGPGLSSDESKACVPGTGWCHSFSDDIDPAQVYIFPFAVLEIKLQDEAPLWVEELIDSNLITAMPKFSKYLTGAAVLHTQTLEKCEPPHVLPFWFEEEAIKQWLAKQPAEGAAPPAPLYQLIEPSYTPAPWPAPSALSPQASGSPPLPPTPTPTPQQPAALPLSDCSHPASTLAAACIDPPSAPQQDRSAVQASVATPDAVGCACMASHGVTKAPTMPPRNSKLDSSCSITMDEGSEAASPISRQSSPFSRKRLLSPSSKTSSANPQAREGVATSVATFMRKTRSFGNFIRMQETPREAKGEASPASSVRASSLRTPRMEPKTFFANERTFTSWLSAAMLLLSVGIALTEFESASGGGMGGGNLIITSALLIMSYGLLTFTVRIRKIKRKDPLGYDDQYGPIFLVLVLGAAIVVYLCRLNGWDFWAKRPTVTFSIVSKEFEMGVIPSYFVDEMEALKTVAHTLNASSAVSNVFTNFASFELVRQTELDTADALIANKGRAKMRVSSRLTPAAAPRINTNFGEGPARGGTELTLRVKGADLQQLARVPATCNSRYGAHCELKLEQNFYMDKDPPGVPPRPKSPLPLTDGQRSVKIKMLPPTTAIASVGELKGYFVLPDETPAGPFLVSVGDDEPLFNVKERFVWEVTLPFELAVAPGLRLNAKLTTMYDTVREAVRPLAPPRPDSEFSFRIGGETSLYVSAEALSLAAHQLYRDLRWAPWVVGNAD